ncbi:MAG: RNA polymerase sigma factor [Rubrivivax sp.]|nr:RNA polymerase sigma factor [Rubrivivax sp.]
MLRFVPLRHRSPATPRVAPDAAREPAAGAAAAPDGEAAAALLAALAQGEPAALEAIYRREAGALFRYVHGLCGNEGWAADATQDAFVALAQRPQAVDLSRGSVGGWLAGVARHAVLAQWRLARRETAWPEDEDDEAGSLQSLSSGGADPDPTPETLLVRAQSGAAVWSAIRRLPLAQREALLLVDLQERSYEEAARIAGIELNTLRTRLHRARARLAQWLEGR